LRKYQTKILIALAFVLFGSAVFSLGRYTAKVQTTTTTTSTTTTTTFVVPNVSGFQDPAVLQWQAYPVGSPFFAISSKNPENLSVGIQCLSNSVAVIPDRGKVSVRDAPDSLWNTLLQDQLKMPSDLHLLFTAVVSPCDPSWAFVGEWENSTDKQMGRFQGQSGPAHFFDGQWNIIWGTEGNWATVPLPIKNSFKSGEISG